MTLDLVPQLFAGKEGDDLEFLRRHRDGTFTSPHERLYIYHGEYTATTANERFNDIDCRQNRDWALRTEGWQTREHARFWYYSSIANGF